MSRQEEEDDKPSFGNRKKYSRSVSWTDRLPTGSSSRPHWNSKARACLPPLQPLAITRENVEEWPMPGSDDLGIWNAAPPTPGLRSGSITHREPLNKAEQQAPIEFEFKKDKLAFFNKECSKIVDYLYLGSDAVAKNREVLRQNGITHVLNCVGFLCPEYFKNDLVYKTLWLQDSPSEDITSILYDVFDYFEDVREQGGRVFVHCCQGVSRSTSLVIAYLMWKEGQSFEDAFQLVKAARGVTNPNMGFACQLLLAQKRVHAQPASPSSVLRMYRMAPHSPYDPLHLVPKLLSEPGVKGLDSRGAFIVHVPSAIYVWSGKHCVPVMSNTARAAAFQVVRYESAQGPVSVILEGHEPHEFWDVLGKKVDNRIEQELTADTDVADVIVGGRKVSEYDLDLELFQKALAGGVVPPFPVPGSGSETCLPARENGWSRLRRKFASGRIKDLITTSKLSCEARETRHWEGKVDAFVDAESVISASHPLSPSSPPFSSSNRFFSSHQGSSSTWMNSTSEEDDLSTPLTGPSLSPSPSFGSLDSVPCSYVVKQNFDTASPSLSPSTSDYSSSFTFSPSSSNWSDMAYLSAQPSPSRLEFKDLNNCKDNALAEESACSLCERTSPLGVGVSPADEFFGKHSCFACRESSPSLAERRWMNPPPRMILPPIKDASQVKVSRPLSFSLPDQEDEMMKEVEENRPSRESSVEMSIEDLVADNEVHSGISHGQFGPSHHP